MSYVGMSRCIYCGGVKEMLVQKEMKDNNAPEYIPVITDFNPCYKCEENMAKGVTLIVVEPYNIQLDHHKRIPKEMLLEGEDALTHIKSKMVPTGNYFVLTEDSPFVQNMNLKTGDRAFIDTKIGNHIKELMK